MSSLNERQLAQHVTIIAWLRILTGSILLLVGTGTVVFLSGLGLLTGDLTALGILALTGLIGGGFLIVLSLPGIAAGIGLLRRQSWGRILALAVAFLDLVNFPVGTAISIYSFVILFQETAPAYFSDAPCCASVVSPVPVS